MSEFRRQHTRSSSRQAAIQAYCCDELSRRGLFGSRPEIDLPGIYRSKKWDVGRRVEDDRGVTLDVTLGISCKSIIANHAGTVPNRIDDMLGEAANLHRRWPRAVIGYFFMMSRVDESAHARKKRTEAREAGIPEAVIVDKARRSGDEWFRKLGESVGRASGRLDETDHPEKFEVVSCSLIEFDLDEPYPVRYHPSTPDPDEFFDRLVQIHHDRFE